MYIREMWQVLERWKMRTRNWLNDSTTRTRTFVLMKECKIRGMQIMNTVWAFMECFFNVLNIYDETLSVRVKPGVTLLERAAHSGAPSLPALLVLSRVSTRAKFSQLSSVIRNWKSLRIPAKRRTAAISDAEKPLAEVIATCKQWNSFMRNQHSHLWTKPRSRDWPRSRQKPQ